FITLIPFEFVVHLPEDATVGKRLRLVAAPRNTPMSNRRGLLSGRDLLSGLDLGARGRRLGQGGLSQMFGGLRARIASSGLAQPGSHRRIWHGAFWKAWSPSR